MAGTLQGNQGNAKGQQRTIQGKWKENNFWNMRGNGGNTARKSRTTKDNTRKMEGTRNKHERFRNKMKRMLKVQENFQKQKGVIRGLELAGNKRNRWQVHMDVVSIQMVEETVGSHCSQCNRCNPDFVVLGDLLFWPCYSEAFCFFKQILDQERQLKNWAFQIQYCRHFMQIKSPPNSVPQTA